MIDQVKGERTGLILITGGVRSGKSSFAEKMAEESGKKMTYLATARVEDEEMRERVAIHQGRRSKNVKTVEEPLEPHLVLEQESDSDSIILIDCLTLLITNRMLKDIDSHGAVREGEDIFADEKIIEAAVERTYQYIKQFSAAAVDCPADILVVTNEVGLGVVPNYPVARAFRDLSGRANQFVAAAADQVWLVVCGIPQRFK